MPHVCPRPLDWCKDGVEVAGEPIYVASSDGRECLLPNPKCVTKNSAICPQFAALPPDWCSGGRQETGPKIFVESTDGMECELPNPKCLTKNVSACR